MTPFDHRTHFVLLAIQAAAAIDVSRAPVGLQKEVQFEIFEAMRMLQEAEATLPSNTGAELLLELAERAALEAVTLARLSGANTAIRKVRPLSASAPTVLDKWLAAAEQAMQQGRRAIGMSDWAAAYQHAAQAASHADDVVDIAVPKDTRR